MKRWAVDIAVLFAALVMARLGVWQLQRYSDRSAVAAARTSAHAAPPLSVVDEEPYRRVRLTGAYTKAFVATGGVRHGLNGYAALGAFQVDGGPEVLVLRGWVPAEGWSQWLKVPTETVIEGIVQPVDGSAEVVALQREEGELWPLGRVPMLGFFSRGDGIPWRSISRASGTGGPVIVLGPSMPNEEERDTTVLPAGGYSTHLKTHHHIEYAVQWFAFALIALGLRWWFGWRGRPVQPNVETST